jgi:hypothetical protein
MEIFFCESCGSRLFFENVACLHCGATVGFLPEERRLAALEPADDGLWRRVGDPGGKAWRMCHNYAVQGVCNWMIPSESTDQFCVACALNRTIPDISDPAKHALWRKMEAAKHRLCFTLLKLGLPLVPKSVDPVNGLAFDFLSDQDPQFNEGEANRRVLTGHAAGVITINLAEADDAVREQMRLNLREVYRTLLGHFRHEIGHYYWDRLVRDSPLIDEVRTVFGDERIDYAESLQRHYHGGGNTPGGWETHFVTAYAAAHPWEDWAETWAHYLHIMDTLETAAAQGIIIAKGGTSHALQDPFGRDFEAILVDWHALRLILNSLNRSMGLADPYPFVISPSVARKLAFIHDWVGQARTMTRLNPPQKR